MCDVHTDYLYTETKVTTDVKLTSKTTSSPGKNNVAQCPTCQKGTIIALKGFYGCSAYKSGCKQTFPGTFLKKKITPNQVKLLCTNGKTNMIKGFVSKAGKKFNAKLTLVDGQLKFEF